MRHADMRTTFNIYGDVVTDEMTTASAKVAQLALLKSMPCVFLRQISWIVQPLGALTKLF